MLNPVLGTTVRQRWPVSPAPLSTSLLACQVSFSMNSHCHLPVSSLYEITGWCFPVFCRASGQHSGVVVRVYSKEKENSITEQLEYVCILSRSLSAQKSSETHLFNTKVKVLSHCVVTGTCKPLSLQLWFLILPATLHLLSWVFLALFLAPLTTGIWAA